MLDKIKVTISQEDGSPLFDQGDSVEYLTRETPVLAVVFDGRTLQTIGGDLEYVTGIMSDLTKRGRVDAPSE